MRRLRLAVGVLSALLAVVPVAAAAPEGQLTWGVHISLAPTWFDPAETLGIITPFMVMYGVMMPSVSAGSKDRKSTRLNSSHVRISYAVFCLKKKKTLNHPFARANTFHLRCALSVVLS